MRSASAITQQYARAAAGLNGPLLARLREAVIAWRLDDEFSTQASSASS
jgi:hypothetical protein